MQRRRGSMAKLYSMGFIFHWFHPLHPPPVLTMLVKQNCSIIPAPSLVWTFCHGGSKYRWPNRIQIYFKQFWWKVLATEFHVTQVPYKKRYTWTPDGHPTAMQRNPSGGKQSTYGSGWACPRGRCPYLLNIHRAGDLLSRLSSRRGWVPMADATSAGSQLKSRTLILLII